jgi:biotin operon repressor
MTYYWTLKLNDAAARRAEQGVQVDTSTQEGRKLVGYSYLERVKE